MPKPRLTAALKRRITEDWLAALPGLAVYRPMHLLRRVGPLRATEIDEQPVPRRALASGERDLGAGLCACGSLPPP